MAYKRLDYREPLPAWTAEWAVDTTAKLARHGDGMLAWKFQHTGRFEHSPPLLTAHDREFWRGRLVGGQRALDRWVAERPQNLPPSKALTLARKLADQALAMWVYEAWDACLDCGIHTTDIGEYFMVQDTLWRKVCPAPRAMMCIGCLEKRLGRELTPADFTDAPINGAGGKSARLLARITGQQVIE